MLKLNKVLKLPTSPSIAFLVELLNPKTGEIEYSDICIRLDTAVDQVFTHLQKYPEVPVQVDVSYDEQNEIEGIGFFDDDHEVISCVTAYHLDRDTDEPQHEEVKLACLQAGQDLETALNKIFGN